MTLVDHTGVSAAECGRTDLIGVIRRMDARLAVRPAQLEDGNPRVLSPETALAEIRERYGRGFDQKE
jgi:hypothetical protein